MLRLIKNILLNLGLTAMTLVLGLVLSVSTVKAVYFPESKVSITFDDGFKSTYYSALPIMSSKDLRGTIYVSSGLIGGKYDGQTMMSWTDVQNLQNKYGWEIGGHTAKHIELPKYPLTRITQELTTSNAAFSQRGLIVTDFASPYGAYDNKVLTEVLKYYDSHRGFADLGLNNFPYNRAVLRVRSVDVTVTPAMVSSWISEAKANHEWLILVFHMVGPVSDNYEYTVSLSDFDAMMTGVKNSGLKVQTVREALVKPGYNALSNSTLSAGMTGWTTDTPSGVTLDVNTNGAYPEAKNSVKMTGGATSRHLFSNIIGVVPGTTYNAETFVNATAVTSGEVGFYVDEYDYDENWISGKWIGRVGAGAVGYFYNLYEPTSAEVYKARFQIYMDPGVKGTAYIDNIVLQNLENTTPLTPSPRPTSTPTPSPIPTATPTVTPTLTPTVTPTLTPTLTPSPTVTPSPVPTATLTPSPIPTATPTVTVTPTLTPSPTVTPTVTPSPMATATPTVTPAPTATPSPTVTPTPTINLVQNGSFENSDGSGWVLSWVRQTINWVVDNLFANEGSKSIKLTGTARTHLFSDLVSIEPGKTYVWSQYIKAQYVGSEFGYYIDEYDINGNWISGQWKGMLTSAFEGKVDLDYTPTSSSVAKVGLQYYYVGGGTDSLINIDSVSLSVK